MSEYRDRVIFIATQTQDYWRVGLPETTTWKEFYRRYDLVYIIMINVYTTGSSCLPNYVKTTDGMIDLCLWQSVESASLPPRPLILSVSRPSSHRQQSGNVIITAEQTNNLDNLRQSSVLSAIIKALWLTLSIHWIYT